MRTNLAKRLQGKTSKSLSNSGFTLMDLMVGATMTTAVIAAAGYGVASMISTSTASTSRSERRAELSRSNDFMATEIREGSGIVKDVSVATELPTASATAFAASYAGKVDTASVRKVLMVKTTETTPIVYFVAKPTSGSARGPRAIYRWGPAFDSTTGNYSNVSTPSSWVSEVLVDQIQNASGTTPTCSSGTVNGDSGFYACVESSGKSAQIFQNGKISKVLDASENYSVSTNAGSRKTTVATTPASFVNGAAAPSWTLSNGVVTVNSSLNMSVRYLGGDIVCGNVAYPIPTFGSVSLKAGSGNAVTTNLNMTQGADTTFSNVAANTTMTISGKAVGNSGSGSCNGSTYGPYSSSSNTTNVRSLKSGDPVPTTSGFLGQTSIDGYLTAASTNPVTNRPIVKVSGSSRTIDLAPNQVIYLFELGGGNPGDASFDLQDMVVLATFQ